MSNLVHARYDTRGLQILDPNDPYVRPDFMQVLGMIPANVSAGSVLTAANNLSNLQAAVLSMYPTVIATPGKVYVDDTLMLDSNTRITIDPSSELISTGGVNFQLFTTSNAIWNKNASGMSGIMLVCASNGTTPGLGKIRRLTAPARLLYTAPGDTEGAAVDVSGAVSGAGRFELASANGKKLYVAVTLAALTVETEATVRIGQNQGAVGVTWNRASNITTVTHVGHGYQPGDAVITFGTGFIGQFFIRTVVPGVSYTFIDSRGNSAGSGEIFGKYNIHILGKGSINYNAAGSGSNKGPADRNHINMLGVSRWSIVGPTFLDGSKYNILGQCISNYDIDVLGFNHTAGTSTAIVQINGKSLHGRIRVSGTSTDTPVALIGGDFAAQTMLFPNDEGGLDFDDTEIWGNMGTASKLDAVRLAGATNLWFRNTRIYNIKHTATATPGPIIGIIVDGGVYLGTETNIEGLLIDGVFPDKIDTNDTAVVYLQTGNTNISSGIVIRRVEAGFPAENQGTGPIRILQGKYADITVENGYQRNQTWQGTYVSTSGAAVTTIDKLTILNSTFRINNALKNTGWASSLFLNANANAVVNSLRIAGCNMTDISAGGQKSIPLWQSAGTLGNVDIEDVAVDGTLDLYFHQNGSAGTKICIRNIRMANTSFFARFDAPAAEIQVGQIRTSTQLVDVVRIGYSAATMLVRSLGGMPALPSSGFHVNIAGGATNSPNVNGLDMVCDITKLAAITGNLVKNSANSRVAMYDGAAWTNIA